MNSLLPRHVEIRLRLRREILTAEIQRSAYLVDAVPADEEFDGSLSIGSDSSATSAHEASILQLNAQIAELDDLNATLKRIVSGNFGDCADCGCAISFERLTCLPTARRCNICEAKNESIRHDNKYSCSQ
ncbi:MAG TPA: hypothetical protein VIF60_10225 [Burkholderiaceae bacterium]